MTARQGTATITAELRLKQALDLDPAVLEYVISLDQHDFVRLRNPLMRRLMAPRITLGRIAQMVGVPVDEVLGRVAQLAGATAAVGATAPPLPHSPAARPDWLAGVDAATAPTVNLLPMDEALDADPLPPVMAAIKALPPGGVLLIRHKWEPQPFYDMWTKMGSLAWFAELVTADEWRIWVRRLPA